MRWPALWSLIFAFLWWLLTLWVYLAGVPGLRPLDGEPTIGQVFDDCYLCSFLIIVLLAVDTLAIDFHKGIRGKQPLAINMFALVLQTFVLIGSLQMVSYSLWLSS